MVNIYVKLILVLFLKTWIYFKHCVVFMYCFDSQSNINGTFWFCFTVLCMFQLVQLLFPPHLTNDTCQMILAIWHLTADKLQIMMMMIPVRWGMMMMMIVMMRMMILLLKMMIVMVMNKMWRPYASFDGLLVYDSRTFRLNFSERIVVIGALDYFFFNNKSFLNQCMNHA